MIGKHISRRTILAAGAAGTAGMIAAPAIGSGGRIHRRDPLRVLSIGVAGTVGETNRREISEHSHAEIVGLCDVDLEVLGAAAEEHPKAFTCRDYRDAFELHASKFDAVVVSTPDAEHVISTLCNQCPARASPVQR